MKYDSTARIVSLPQLEDMCKHVSDTCHRYRVESVTRSRVHVSYSNPDEYGHESPMIAVFPCWPAGQLGTVVALEILRVLDDNQGGEGWQAFDPLLSCPEIFNGREYRLHNLTRRIDRALFDAHLDAQGLATLRGRGAGDDTLCTTLGAALAECRRTVAEMQDELEKETHQPA